MLKPNSAITKKQAASYFAAFRHLREHKPGLGLHITLNLSHTRCPPGEAPLVMKRLINRRFGRWWNYLSKKMASTNQPDIGPPIYGWVIEAPNGITHAHWCVYIDPRFKEEFERKLPRWLADVSGGFLKEAGAIHIQNIHCEMGIARYCLKGIQPVYAKQNYIHASDQGVVYGQRVALSKSLGYSARKSEMVSLPTKYRTSPEERAVKHISA